MAGSFRSGWISFGSRTWKQHHFVSVEAQRFDGAHDLFGRFVEIGNDHDQAAAAQEFLKMEERLGEIGARARFGQLQAA
jgi:hypothetical protein